MKTEIGTIRLSLPAGFEGRGQRIGRLVGEALARQEGLPAGQIPHVRVGPVQVDVRRSDRAVAESIAQGIVRSLRGAVNGQEA